MFDILMYLFENYVHSEIELLVDEDELTKELTRAGFHQADILKALSWLERLADLQESDTPYLCNHAQQSFRIYTKDEMAKLDVESRGFLLFLEQIKVLSVETREMVIDRVMELDEASLILDDLKWVILMVLFNVPGNESAYEQMEDLIFEQPEGRLHS
jgi:Smg protein